MSETLIQESSLSEYQGYVLQTTRAGPCRCYCRGTGPCMEYLLRNGEFAIASDRNLLIAIIDVLGTLIRLSELDRPSGILAEVLRTVSNMVVLLDEQFLIHSAVHKAIIRLLRVCAGDELQDKIDGRNKVMGAAAHAVRPPPSEYELDCKSILV